MPITPINVAFTWSLRRVCVEFRSIYVEFKSIYVHDLANRGAVSDVSLRAHIEPLRSSDPAGGVRAQSATDRALTSTAVDPRATIASY